MYQKEGRLLKIPEASNYLGVKESWLRAKIFQKSIPIIKLDGLVRFDREELDDWLQQKKKPAE